MSITVGSILSRSFSTLMKNIGVFFVIALVFNIPAGLIEFFVVPKLGSAMAQKAVSQISQSLFGGLVTASILYGVVQSLGGGSANLAESLRVTFARIVPIFLVSLLYSIGVFIGTLLLIVPGVILACMWYVAVPATVVERKSVMDSFTRSAELTKGHRMTLFLTALVFIGITVAIMMLVLAPMIVGGASPLIILIIVMAVAVTFGLWSSVAMGVAYHDLRVAKEGANTSDLVQVFT